MSNTYVCFYKRQQVTVQAATSYEAQKLAAAQLKAKRLYEVHVVLAAVEGVAAPVSTASL